MRPLYQRLLRSLVLTGADAFPLDTPVRPHSGLHVSTERFHGGVYVSTERFHGGVYVSSLLISQDCCTFEE